MKSTLDLVLLVGPKIDINTLRTDYNQTGLSYRIIGDGEKPVNPEDLADLLGPKTRIDILAHGHTQDGNHSMELFFQHHNTLTSEIFDKLGQYLPVTDSSSALDSRIQVHLWSCMGGAAAKDIWHLPAGTVLVTHASSKHGSYLGMSTRDIGDGIRRYQAGVTPLTDFLYCTTTSPETATLTMVHDGTQIQYTAKSSSRPLTSDLERDLNHRIICPYVTALYPLRESNDFNILMSDVIYLSLTEETLAAYRKNACYIKQNLNNLTYIRAYLKKTPPDADLFIYACGHSRPPIIRQLLADKRLDPNGPNSFGSFPLHITVGTNSLPNTLALLADKRIKRTHVDSDGNTALHLAARDEERNAILTVLLREDSIHESAVNNKGLTALHLAAQYAGPKNLTALLRSPWIDVNLQHHNGTSFLFFAARFAKPENLKLVLDNADVVKKWVDKNGNTPLHYAAQYSTPENITMLMTHRKINPNARNHEGKTALHLAVQHDHDGRVQALLANPRTDRNMRDNNGYTPLHSAVRNNGQSLIHLLMADQHIDANIKDICGNTPLHLAVTTRNCTSVEILLDYHKLDLDLVNNEGNTALHDAVRTPDLSILHLLLKNGADTSIVNQAGKTALDLAKDLTPQPTGNLMVALLTPIEINLVDPPYTNAKKITMGDRTKLELYFSHATERDRVYSDNQPFFTAIACCCEKEAFNIDCGTATPRLDISWSNFLNPDIYDRMEDVSDNMLRNWKVTPPPASSTLSFQERVTIQAQNAQRTR